MRVLEAANDPARRAAELTDADLLELYAQAPGVRTNGVSTLDGAATGPDGVSGSINNAADHRVFAAIRANCDAVLVGAGTVRAEEYGPLTGLPGSPAPTLVVVSRRGRVPASVLSRRQTPGPGAVVLATCAAPGEDRLAEARRLLGDEAVWVVGETHVDLPALVARLRATGRERMVCEGGPSLAADMHAAGLVDEVAATIVPRLLGGDHPRRVRGAPVDVDLELRLLLAEDSTLLGLWRVVR